jgi:hypothetical protein
MAVRTEADRAWEAGLRAFEILIAGIRGAEWSPVHGFAIARCPSMPIPLANGVWVLDDALDGQALREAADDLLAAGLPAPVLVRESIIHRVEDAVHAAGRKRASRTPIMVTTRDELAVREVDGFRVDRAGDGRSFRVPQRLAEEGFGTPPGLLAPMYEGPLRHGDDLATFVGSSDGRPVTTAVSVRDGSMVGIYNVATPPMERRRGYGGAVTAAVVAEAFEDGATFAYLQASAMGTPVYREIGFREVDAILSFDRPADDGG